MGPRHLFLTIGVLCGLGIQTPLYSQVNSSSHRVTLGEEGFIQTRPATRESEQGSIKTLTLSAAIEQGLRENFGERIREIESQRLDLHWEDQVVDFWYPRIEANFETRAHRIGTMHEGSLGGQIGTDLPIGELNLSIRDYTLFNWGRDYLSYLNARDQNKRAKERLNEEKRELKHRLIITYANLLTTLEVEEIKRKQLQHATYIYNLNREKVSAQNVSRQEYYQARSEYLRAQTEFYQARVHNHKAHELMSELLSDPAGTRYTSEESIRYTLLSLSSVEARELAIKRNPDILDAQTSTAVATRSYDLARRNNLPLPRFSLTLGAYQHGFGEGQRHSTRYLTRPGTSDVEIIASINANWTLLGSGGPFNSRSLKQSYLGKRIGQINQRHAEHYTLSAIQQHFYSINHFQTQMQIVEPRVITLKRTFDTVMDNYIRNQSSFQDFRQVLIEKIEAQELKSVTRFEHLKEKVELASRIGIEDFPGENFEDLIVR